MSRPMLSLGSAGSAVQLLQVVLNTYGGSVLAALVVDGAFGKKTDARVKEFQRAVGLANDGIVGPLTYTQLEPLLVVFEVLSDFGRVPPAVEAAARERVCATAEMLYLSLGWSLLDADHTLAAVGPDNPRILAKVAAGPADEAKPPKAHWRQGGRGLAALYRFAGAFNPAQCVTISSAMWAVYGRPGPANSAVIPFPLSNNDIGSWCGIFCNAVFRLAGLATQNWKLGGGNGGLKVGGLLGGTGATVPDFVRLGRQATPQKGDIGIEDSQNLNHHFLVIDVIGDSLITIEGNAGYKPTKSYSEIIRREAGGVREPRSLAGFRLHPTNSFVTPIWAQLGVK